MAAYSVSNFGVKIKLYIGNTAVGIDAPARTPKNPEGRVHSGLVRSKSNDVGRLWGFQFQFRF